MPKSTSDCCATGCKRLWPKVRLGDVCEVKAGRDYKDVESPDGKYPIYGTGGVMGMSREWRCPAGSVIVGRKGTLDNPMLINEPFWNIDTCFGVVPSDKLLPAYLWRFCQNFDFYSLVPASGRPSTTSDAVKAIKLPLPPLAEQKKIVEKVEKALKRVDALKAQFERMEESAADYFKAALAETFAAVKGEKVKLGDVCVNCDSQRIPITKADRRAGAFPYYGASGIVDYVDQYIFDGDFLLVSEDGANLLARSTPIAFSVSGKIWVNNHAHVLRFESMDTQRYVEYFFASIDIADRVTGAAQPKLTQNALNAILLPYPSLEIQREVVKRLTEKKCTASRLEEAARRCIGICGKMRKAILAEAFQ